MCIFEDESDLDLKNIARKVLLFDDSGKEIDFIRDGIGELDKRYEDIDNAFDAVLGDI